MLYCLRHLRLQMTVRIYTWVVGIYLKGIFFIISACVSKKQTNKTTNKHPPKTTKKKILNGTILFDF